MSNIFKNVVILLCVLSITGCQVWYKKGASAEQLMAQQKDCESVTNSKEGTSKFNRCMEQQGWSVSNPELQVVEVKAGPVSTENKTTAVKQKPTLLEKITPDAKNEADKVVNQVSRQASVNEHGQEKVIAIETVEEGLEDEPQEVFKPNLGAWFKVGASPVKLKNDQKLCFNLLDDVEQRNAQKVQWQVTPEFTRCMREKGWYALGS